MKNILIMGCSWGVPNYYGPPGVPETDHTEYLLKNLGYNVLNCSANGSTNLNALKRAILLLTGHQISHPAHGDKIKSMIKLTDLNIKIDWVVWFHTELLRDYDSNTMPRTIDAAVEHLGNLIYPQIFDFFKSINAKCVIIGGIGPVHPSLYKYGTPDFIIEDWKSELVGKKLPPQVHTLSRLDIIENSEDTLEYKNKLLDDHLTIMSAMSESKKFPDGSHPGTQPHKELTEYLHNIFKNYS